MKVLPPREGMPENTVMFECSFQMSRTEIRDYLKDLYNLESVQINTEVCYLVTLLTHFSRLIRPRISHLTHSSIPKLVYAYLLVNSEEPVLHNCAKELYISNVSYYLDILQIIDKEESHITVTNIAHYSCKYRTQVVDGERFKYTVPELGVKTHTNTHKKIAYVVLKDKIMQYPSKEFFRVAPKTVEEPSSSQNPQDLVTAPS